MTEKSQPEALKHATYLESFFVSEDVSAVKARKIAAELRRQHALNAELLAALKGMLEAYDDGVTDWEKPYQQAARAVIAKTTGAAS